MTDGRTGRLLAASLHEAIHHELPPRAEFYEHWLQVDRLRDGSLPLAGLSAVLGFLRGEGEGYDRVVHRAGQLAGEWMVAGMSPLRRRAIEALPRFFRVRVVMGLTAQLVRHLHGGSRASTRVRGTHGQLDIRASLFCTARETPPGPLCGFYIASTRAILSEFGVEAAIRIEHCRAVGGGVCVIVVDLREARAIDPAVAA